MVVNLDCISVVFCIGFSLMFYEQQLLIIIYSNIFVSFQFIYNKRTDPAFSAV